MGSLWCRDLDGVRVPRTACAKAVTLILPYYENPDFLRRQIGIWLSYPARLTEHLRVIVVDDGSPDHPAREAVSGLVPPFLRLFRIEQDVRWNWLAARNIGAHEASHDDAEGWLLLTDMDHVVPPETLEAVIWGAHDGRVIYAFARREHTGHPITPHPNSFLMTRQMFWTVGGYDETLSGHYGTDGDFRRRCAAVARMLILDDPLERYEFVGDSSTTRYQRKQPEDAAVRHLVAARGRQWKPKTLSFAYEAVSL